MDSSINRLYRIRRTIMHMLRDREYLVADFELALSKEQFREKYGDEPKRDDLVIRKAKRSDPDDQIIVFFPDEAKVMKTYARRMESESVYRAIVVVPSSLAKGARDCMSEMAYQIEVFQELELLVNIKEHVLVPEHQVLSAEEKKTLLERYSVKESQLPRMQEQDPVARYYGLKHGQVVKIIRPSETAGTYVTYRYVV